MRVIQGSSKTASQTEWVTGSNAAGSCASTRSRARLGLGAVIDARGHDVQATHAHREGQDRAGPEMNQTRPSATAKGPKL